MFGQIDRVGNDGGGRIGLGCGIAAPASNDLGHMPAFKDSLNDGQVAELVSRLRQQFAPDKPPWADVPAAVSGASQTASR